jgi:phage terminase large subunit-like protein
MKLWADELGAWRYSESWDQAMFGLRLGKNPQAVITTTPKPVAMLKEIIADKHTVITRGTSYENRANLAPAFFDAIVRKYEGTRLGRQELEAELLDDVPGALWTQKLIDRDKLKHMIEVRWDLLVRIVVAIDPAVSHLETSDETGIVVAALTQSGHVVVLDDLSGRYSAAEWASVALAAYRRRKADVIVAEVNNGGDLVAGNIHGADPAANVKSVRASRGKYIRAEPVAALYEQGRVHHVGSFPDLENQMCMWTPQSDQRSPDRLDALVWAITELVIAPQEAGEMVVQFNQPYRL